jgi:hypothetical protein
VECGYSANMFNQPGDSGGPLYYWRFPLLSTVRVPEGIVRGRLTVNGVAHTTYNVWSTMESELGWTMTPY